MSAVDERRELGEGGVFALVGVVASTSDAARARWARAVTRLVRSADILVTNLPISPAEDTEKLIAKRTES